MVRRASGVLDDNVSPANQLSADVNYDAPRTRGGSVCDLVDDLSGKRVLDLGCGRAPDRGPLEAKGAEWVGLDLTGPECSVIGDGDHLPFRDGAFDAVLCAAVLEHMPDPDTIMTEVKRVLAPGGRFLGYVAFLEPMHGLSYFHMSHLGLEHLLQKHGFRPVTIYPSRIGTAYQVECLLFPKYVPVLQPAVGALLQWSFGGLYRVNRLARWFYHRFRRRRPADNTPVSDDADAYRRLLNLRFGVGFNFVAVRGDTSDGGTPGYRKLAG